MLEKTLKKIAKVHESFPKTVIVFFMIFSIFMFYNALSLEKDASFDVMFTDDSQSMELKKLVSNEYGSNDVIYVLVSIDDSVNVDGMHKDLRHPDVLKSIHELSQNLEKESVISSVITAPSLLISQYGRLPETFEESKMFFDNLVFDKNMILNEDYSYSNMIINVDISKKPDSIEKIEHLIKDIVRDSQKPVGVKFTLTGEPILVNHIMELLIQDNIVTVIIALIAVFLILCYYFRSITIGSIAVTPVILTLTYLAATMVFLDIRITMITAAIGAMMVGMSVDYSIHITHGFYDEIKRGNKSALEYVVTHVGGALFASAMTTLFGFLAMTLGDSPMSQTQGLVLALGITFAFLSSLLVLPALLSLHHKYGFHSEEIINKHRLKKKKKSIVAKGLEYLSKLQVKFSKSIVVFFVVVTIFLLPGMMMVRLDTDNENWFQKGDPVIDAINTVGITFSGTTFQTYLVMINNTYTNGQSSVDDLRDVKLLDALSRASTSLLELEYVTSIDEPTKYIKQFNNGRLPNDQKDIDTLVSEKDMIRSYFNADYSILKVNVGLQGMGNGGPGNNNNAKMDELKNEFETALFPENIVVVGQGGFVQGQELDRTLSSDIAKTTLIGFIFVFVLVLLFYRSIVAGAMAIVPIIFSAIWTVCIMGYIDLPFTVLTTGMLAIVMGMGIDFSIHLIHTTKLNLKNGDSISDAVFKALTGTGESIFVSTLTTIVGFSSLILASLLATQRLGFTLAIAIFCCFMICILLVPAILVIEYNVTNKLSKIKNK